MSSLSDDLIYEILRRFAFSHPYLRASRPANSDISAFIPNKKTKYFRYSQGPLLLSPSTPSSFMIGRIVS